MLHGFEQIDTNENDGWGITEPVVVALLLEVATTQKPGLVCPESSGSHEDMSLLTFMVSIGTLIPTFVKLTELGFSFEGSPRRFLEEVRRVGLPAEGKMLEATCGVNTHKGSLFALGLLTACAAQTRAVEGSLESAKVLLRVSQVAEGIVERELEACTQPETAGERLFKTYGIKGIRGEAEHGFPSVRLEGLPALNEAFSVGLTLSESLRHALVHIMAYAEDTTVIHRGGLACFQQMQRLAREVCEKGGMLTERGRSAYEWLCRFCLDTNISPGGCADLLACTVACYLWDNHYFPVEVK